MKGPLKWHGGKFYLQKDIHALAPKAYETRVIGCAGGMQELWNWACPHCGEIPPLHSEDCSGLSEIVNDTHGELTNFYSVLRASSYRRELFKALDLTPFSRAEFVKACKPDGRDSRVERARKFFVKYRQSRQGLGKDFATLSTARLRRKINEQSSSWLAAIDGLPEAAARLTGVVVENLPVVDLIRKVDSPTTFFYLDPPYLKSTRVADKAYEDEMSYGQHLNLLLCLAGIEGKFLLSGYDSELYQEAAENEGWRKVTVDVHCSSSSKKKKDQRQECFWRNYDGTSGA